ncbi:MAG: hypothetical protein HC860_08880 [Alkalinema sp. RU_4_3]|nr:hypothetical protein [Alkalinema sp. RU_4_3]
MPDSVGNTLSTATAISVNPGKYTFDRPEQVGSGDPLDIYKFTLAGKSSFSAAAVDLTGDVSLTLYSGTTASPLATTAAKAPKQSLPILSLSEDGSKRRSRFPGSHDHGGG